MVESGQFGTLSQDFERPSCNMKVSRDTTSISVLKAPASPSIPVFVYDFHLPVSCEGPTSASCCDLPRSITI